ncbi:MAG: polysaccharide deacetylase family protein [Oscillospiraceae bacterium]
MRMVTFTKKKVKRLTAIGLLAAATAAAGIGAIVTSVGTQAQERLLPIYSVERGDNKIALTFDVAWENSNTKELLDILDEYDAKATFFITGDWCDRYPDDVQQFAAAGHEIANHSDQHPHVEGIKVNDLIDDTREASNKLKSLTGKEPALYRAPYGEYDNSLITTVEGMGMKVIQWDVETLDTDGNPRSALCRAFRGLRQI